MRQFHDGSMDQEISRTNIKSKNKATFCFSTLAI